MEVWRVAYPRPARFFSFLLLFFFIFSIPLIFSFFSFFKTGRKYWRRGSEFRPSEDTKKRVYSQGKMQQTGRGFNQGGPIRLNTGSEKKKTFRADT